MVAICYHLLSTIINPLPSSNTVYLLPSHILSTIIYYLIQLFKPNASFTIYNSFCFQVSCHMQKKLSTSKITYALQAAGWGILCFRWGKNRLNPELCVNLFYTGYFIQKVPLARFVFWSNNKTKILSIRDILRDQKSQTMKNPLYLTQKLPLKIKHRGK